MTSAPVATAASARSSPSAPVTRSPSSRAGASGDGSRNRKWRPSGTPASPSIRPNWPPPSTATVESVPTRSVYRARTRRESLRGRGSGPATLGRSQPGQRRPSAPYVLSEVRAVWDVASNGLPGCELTMAHDPSSNAPSAPPALPFSSMPAPFGLYDPRFEHDACGVSFVVDVKGRVSRDIVDTALGALCNLDHRGASGAEVNTGDGAGILVQVPDAFLRAVAGFDLPPAGHYGVGLAFLPLDATDAEKAMARIEQIVEEEGLRILGWRRVPVDDSMIGPTARSVIPSFSQLFVDDPAGATGVALDRKLFVVR